MDNSGGASANIQASLAGRYATALFELARDAKAIDAVEKNKATVNYGVFTTKVNLDQLEFVSRKK